jgi:hypothetical protein
LKRIDSKTFFLDKSIQNSLNLFNEKINELKNKDINNANKVKEIAQGAFF